MRKLIALLMIIACLFALCSCNIFGTIGMRVVDEVLTAVYPDYEEEPETFYFAELSITLTESFLPYMNEENGASFVSMTNTTVLVEKHPFLYSPYEEGLTLDEYAAIFRERALGGEIFVYEELHGIGEVESADGVVCLTCEIGYLGSDKCLISFHVGADALWICYFICDEYKFDTYLPHFVGWAASVKISNTETQA